MQNFRKLRVWHAAHSLVLEVYRNPQLFPSDERYGLTSQLRRAAVSIAANLAEGCGRDGDADFARFVQIAMGSASEVEYHLILAHDLQYLSNPQYEQLAIQLNNVKHMLLSFLRKLRS